jgi:hypothetical protein
MAPHSHSFHNKKVERHTERQRQKRSVKRPHSKARLRRQFEAMLKKLVEALRIFPRVPGAAERERHLRGILALLDSCLEEKPQSQVLRQQRRICFEALQEILRGPAAAGRVEIPVLLDDPEAMHVALRARVHPPASDRRSYN